MKREILIIEDDPEYSSSIKDSFNQENYLFYEASTVPEALHLIEENPRVRVVLLDLNLSGHSGEGFLEVIKSRAPYFRIIILTAYEDLLLAELAESYKVFNYLPKVNKDFIQSTQPIRFSIDQAFNDIDREYYREKVSRIVEIQKKINANCALDEILNAICLAIYDLTGVQSAHIRVYNSDTGHFTKSAYIGFYDVLETLLDNPKKKGEYFSGLVVSTKGPVLINNAQTDPRFLAYKEGVLKSGMLKKEVREALDRAASAYGVPIFTGIFGNDVDAVLNVTSDQQGFFSEDKCELINEFVEQATLVLTKYWLETKRKEARQDYGEISSMISEISSKLRRGDNVRDEIYEVVIDKISQIVNPEMISILMFDETTRELQNKVELRGDEKKVNVEESYQAGQSLTGSVFQEGKTIWRPNPKRSINPTEDSRYDKKNKERYEGYIPSGKLRHYLGVPIKVGKEVKGVLRAINKKAEGYDQAEDKKSCILERGFSEDCKNVLEITASHLSAAIRNIELVERLETLNSVSQIFSSQTDIDQLLDSTLEKTAEVMHAEICMLFLKDKNNDRVILRKCYGMPMIPGASYEVGEGVTGGVAGSGKSHLIPAAYKNDGKYDSIILDLLKGKHGKAVPIASLMAVPVPARGNTLGVIKVINKLGDRFQYNDEDLKFFETFASHMGAALENIEIHQQEISMAQRSTLHNLVRAVVHEINNTSGLIPANVQAIKAVLQGPSKEIINMLDTIEDSAKQAVGFAKEIADFSSSRMGNKETLDINRVISRAIYPLLYDLKKYPNFKNITIELDLATAPISCDMHAVPFIQIVRNIVINAYQAMEKTQKGKLTISSFIDQHTNNATIRFADNGCGIKEEHKPRIFEIEFSTKDNGNGIGLWLVKTHLEQIRGTIDFESRENRGTTFTIKLPLINSKSKG